MPIQDMPLPSDRPLRFEFFLGERDYARNEQLWIAVQTQRGNQCCTLTMQDHQPGDLTTPTIAGVNKGDARAFLQGALDYAWKIGLRPEGWREPAPDAAEARAELGAVKDHLKDMRDLVFNHALERKNV